MPRHHSVVTHDRVAVVGKQGGKLLDHPTLSRKFRELPFERVHMSRKGPQLIGGFQ